MGYPRAGYLVYRGRFGYGMVLGRGGYDQWSGDDA